MRGFALKLFVAGLICATALAPSIGLAQRHRQQTKNQWRNLAIGSAALGAYGLLRHNSTIALLGAAGAGYSALRYEHDRKSQRRYQDWYGYNRRDRNYNGYNNGGYNYNNGGYAYNTRNGRDFRHHDNGRHLGWYKHHGRSRDCENQHGNHNNDEDGDNRD